MCPRIGGRIGEFVLQVLFWLSVNDIVDALNGNDHFLQLIPLTISR